MLTSTLPLGAPRVLLIEDDPDQAALIARWLTAAGIWVKTAYDAVTALSFVEQPFDVVLCDMNLPCGDGVSVVAESKRRFPSRPAVLMTAHDTGQYARLAARSDADDLIHKPLRRAGVIETVQHWICRGTAPRPGRRVLAIGAHPDDVEIGVGGTLLRHRAAGDHVAVATLSAGSCGGEGALRRQESERAARSLEARLFVGTLPDTRMTVGPESIGWIEAVCREVDPDIVYVHSVHDRHQDHRATHEAALVAARHVPGLYAYQSPSATTDFRPERFIDISAHVDGKLDVIAHYASQTARCSYLEPDLLRSTARYWSRFTNVAAAEPLEIIRDCH